MMKWIHRNKESIGIVFLVIAAAFAVSGVGVDILHQKTTHQFAIKIDKHEIGMDEYYQTQRRMEEQYRRMFGANYAELAKSLGLNLGQQASDQLIDGHLLERDAEKYGFATSDQDVQRFIVSRVFAAGQSPEGFSPAAYQEFLRNQGMSPHEFESAVRSDILRSYYAGLMTDVSFASKQEAKTKLEREETEFTATAYEVSPTKLVAEVPAPKEDELKKFYDANATDFDLPARVSYEYAVFSPDSFKKEVAVTPQYIELYYTDNQDKYTTPEEVRVRVIKLLYPKDPDPKKMSDVREKATKAHEEALSGKPFEALVTQYSDDIPSKATGGSLGWIKRGSQDEQFDAAVFKMTSGGVADLIETDYGFQIAKVEEYKASGVTPLADVKSGIEEELRAQEAPAYAAAKAREIVEKNKSSDKPLSELGKEQNFAVAVTSSLLEKEKDPEPALKGLTAKLFELPDGDRASRQVIDLGDKTVLVQVTQFKEEETEAFENAKSKVLAQYKKVEAEKLADGKANALVAAPDIKAKAQELKITAVAPQKLKRGKAGAGPFADSQLLAGVYATKSPGYVLPQPFRVGDSIFVVQVNEIAQPDPAKINEKVDEFRAKASQDLAKNFVDSELARARVTSNIEFGPVLANRE